MRLCITAKDGVAAESSAIREIDEVLAALEDFDDPTEVSTSQVSRKPVLGKGDLLDDFVVEASQAKPDQSAPDASAADDDEDEDFWGSESEDESDSSTHGDEGGSR